MGRPSTYDSELFAAICERVSEGEPLAAICREEGMPPLRTVYNWMRDIEGVEAQFARARVAGYDMIAQDALRIADDGSSDTYTDANGFERTNNEVVQRSKLRVETRLKLLAKWDPKRYGERMTHAGDPDAPLQVSTPDDQLDTAIAAALARAGIPVGR